MSEQVRSEQIARSRTDENPGPLAGITLINDSGTTVTAIVGHWWWGLVTVAYVNPGHRILLPAGSAANDVFLLNQVTAHVAVTVIELPCTSFVTFNKKKVVHSGATVKVSEF